MFGEEERWRENYCVTFLAFSFFHLLGDCDSLFMVGIWNFHLEILDFVFLFCLLLNFNNVRSIVKFAQLQVSTVIFKIVFRLNNYSYQYGKILI